MTAHLLKYLGSCRVHPIAVSTVYVEGAVPKADLLIPRLENPNAKETTPENLVENLSLIERYFALLLLGLLNEN